jgi:hypothetical protein
LLAFNTDGSLDTVLQPGTGANSSVRKIISSAGQQRSSWAESFATFQTQRKDPPDQAERGRELSIRRSLQAPSAPLSRI